MKSSYHLTGIVILFMAAALISGCQNEFEEFGGRRDSGLEAGEAASFTATIESGAMTKTLLAGVPGGTAPRPVRWTKGDSIRINGKPYVLDSLYTAGDSATFRAADPSGYVTPEGGSVKYKAWYPASLYNNDNPTLPAVQEYEAPVTLSGQTYPKIAHLPMYAESSNTKLKFHNLCAVVNVRLTGSASNKVDSVVVTSASNYLSGPFEVKETSSGSGEWYAEVKKTDPAASKRVKLNCGAAVALSPDKATEFLVAIPAGTYPKGDLAIKVYAGATEIARFTNTDASATDLERSQIFDMAKTPRMMQFGISAGSHDKLTLPFASSATWPAAVEIDWGDGNTNTYPAGSSAHVSHQYTGTGYYEVRINLLSIDTVVIPPIVPNDDIRQMLRVWRTPLPRMTTEDGSKMLEDGSKMFMGCIALEAVPSDLFVNNPQLKNLDSLFFDCQFLRISDSDISGELFAHCPELTSLAYAFYRGPRISGSRMGIVLSEKMFANCPKLENLSHAFAGSSSYYGTATGSIPPDLFVNCPELKDVSYLFYASSSLSGSIPPDLFANNPKVTSFAATFTGTSLTGPIPENLFAKNREVTSFARTFASCRNLSGPIPENLFANNPKVTSFESTFRMCNNLSGPIPENLFAKNEEVTSFESTFYACHHLSGPIPENLFANNPEVTSFISTFELCESLSGPIPGNLFAKNKKVESFEKTFVRDTSLTGPIPGNLFAENGEVKSFEKTFTYCRYLTGPIPGNLFEKNTKVTTFRSTFATCSRLSGPIPGNLFEKNTEVEDFGYVFARAGMTGEIPSGLFANNLKAYLFDYAFYQCSKNLTLRPDIFLGTDYNGIERTSENRFAHLTSAVDFSGCFTGYTRAVSGTAPALWDYTYQVDPIIFGTCKPLDFTANNTPAEYIAKNGVFSPATDNAGNTQSSNLSNYDDIPNNWKQVRQK